MTKLQIDFYEAKSQKEHWDRTDAENERHNRETENLNRSQLDYDIWFGQEKIRQGDDANIANRAHYERQDANTAYANQATKEHYERSDAINQNYNQILGSHYSVQDQLDSEKVQLELAKEYGTAKTSGTTFVVGSGLPVSFQKKAAETETIVTNNQYLNVSDVVGVTSSVINALIRLNTLGTVISN